MKSLLLALLLTSTAALADGVDDPNFYKDFEKNPCAYELGLPAAACNQSRHAGRVLPRQSHWGADSHHHKERPVKSIPEPEITSLLGLGLLVLVAKKKFFN